LPTVILRSRSRMLSFTRSSYLRRPYRRMTATNRSSGNA
jgi:hypothetical protein